MTYFKYEAWLREKAAARLGGVASKLPPIKRGLAWSATITLTPDDAGVDLTDGALALTLGYAPNDGASDLFDATVGTVTEASGVFTVPVSLTAVQTATIAVNADGTAIDHLYWEMTFTPTGEGVIDVQAGIAPVLGSVDSV